MNIRNYLISLAFLAAPALAEVSVSDAWVRATVPVQKATGAFMVLKADKDLRLVGVETPLAGVAEVHEMKMDGNVMQMRAMAGLDLPAGKDVKLAPGGYHIMLMQLKQQVKEGDSVPLTLILEDKAKKREKQTISVPAKALTHH
ncbi:copper chaperone PCu(A)C [Massilia sp. TS11]|uniref:copper chaperone PCu(A)C n=1 Tax=Massilia sp. TS11 TaxID=2908003 RepID=UPI001EDB8E94|nr:copper chaperone PCu(A)C [Massilia sp. TS11]MCG2584406.1 copper chaperone PCu(A)C [Massilia sp. TS11]